MDLNAIGINRLSGSDRQVGSEFRMRLVQGLPKVVRIRYSLYHCQRFGINKAMLGSDVIADLNKTITITRDMLPQDVRDDLNATIGMNRLSSEVTGKLERNALQPTDLLGTN